MRDPLLAPAVAVAAGVVVSRLAAFEPRELWPAVAALAVLAVLRRRTAKLACLPAFFFAGGLLEVAHRPGPPPGLDAAPRELVLLEGCVVEPPVFYDEREQFVLELEPGARARVNLYLRPGEQAPALRYGQRVEVEARARPVHNFQNPGSFDYAAYLARRDIYWTASARAGRAVRILPGRCGSQFLAGIFHLRAAALERLEELYRGDRHKLAMAQAVLIGDASKLEQTWTDDFRRTGTYHALVISGLHVTVLAAFFLFLFRCLFVPAGVALALTAAAAWVYALVAGWQPPVLRAAAGLTLYAAGRFAFRRTRVVNLLAALALIFLAFDPAQIFEASFQLSFLAVGAIGALAAPAIQRTSGPLVHGLQHLGDPGFDLHLEPRAAHFRLELRLLAETLQLWSRVPDRFWLEWMRVLLRAAFYIYEIGVVSAAVQLALVLPMVAYFHRLSLTGLSANILIVPLMTAFVPLGFVAIVTGWQLPAVMGGWLIGVSQWLASLHAGWEPAWRVPQPPLWLALGFSGAVIAIAFLRRRVLAAAFAAAMLAVVVAHPFRARVAPGTLELSAIDVGQGESLFLGFPDGKTMLLDGGGVPALGRRARPRLDIGEDVVSPYLWSRSIRRLDAVAISHGHEDHAGGIPALLANFRPKEVWAAGLTDSVRRAAERAGARIVELKAGDRLHYGGVLVEALAPQPERLGPEPHNNDSLVLRITHGAHSFLLTGDIERDVERELVASGLGRVAVLKLAHHGSRTSSTPAFVEALRPAVAVVSAGWQNSFSNPHPEVVARLEALGTRVVGTHAWGLVTVRSDGRRLELDTARWSSAPWRLQEPF